MIELKGKYTDCRIFSDNLEEQAVRQVYTFLNHPVFEGKKVRFMPDIHAGAGAVIGTTVELGDRIIPNVIGVDIGCGMLSIRLQTDVVNYEKLDKFITGNIPSGFNSFKKPVKADHFLTDALVKVCHWIGIETGKALCSIGTLGGGNHFIEVGKDEEERLWLTIHSGSRNFGLQVAKYHQNIAGKEMNRHKTGTSHQETIPKGMEYLSGEGAEKYIEHMKIAQKYASVNRYTMARKILDYLDTEYSELIESVHNYIDFEDRVIRKGAISAGRDESVVIPWNMRDGLVIGKGLGNPDWNSSAPHGAGRLMSRTRAKKEIGMDEFRDSMTGVYSSSVVKSTLDESPMAYKKCEEIEKYLKESVKIVHRVKPLYNFKAK